MTVYPTRSKKRARILNRIAFAIELVPGVLTALAGIAVIVGGVTGWLWQ